MTSITATTGRACAGRSNDTGMIPRPRLDGAACEAASTYPGVRAVSRKIIFKIGTQSLISGIFPLHFGFMNRPGL
jgi:hypothetical protein